jgi:hypothetical protein
LKKFTIFLICFTFLATPVFAAKVKAPFITRSEGDVTLKPDKGNIWEPVMVGRIVEGLDTIKTGQESRAELKAPSGTIRLYQNTVLNIPNIYEGKDGAMDINSPNVEEGTGIFKIKWRGRKNKFNVTTKHIVAVVKGTTYAVKRIDKESTVACIFGKVIVSAQNKNVTEEKISLGPGKMVIFTEGIGFGKILNFIPDISIWNLWKEELELELEVDPEGGQYFIGGDSGNRDDDCPDEDILW